MCIYIHVYTHIFLNKKTVLAERSGIEELEMENIYINQILVV